MNDLTFPGDEQVSQWFAVRTATRREGAAAEALKEAGITAFLPMGARWGFRSRFTDKVRIETPLMPGYLFVLIEPSHIRRVLNIDAVHAFVGGFDDQGDSRPLSIPLAAIIEIQTDERAGRYDGTLYYKPKYNPKKGDRVKIIAGPWLNFLGRVLSTPKRERAHVMIEGPFGRGAAIDASYLTPAA